MVFSIPRGALLAVLALTVTVRAQTPLPTPVAPPPSKPGERIITVQEVNRPPLFCRVVKTWRMADGAQAYQVQSQETGELLTIVESGQLATPPSVGRPRIRAVATRIYHWGRNTSPPVGVPQPPADLLGDMPIAERMPSGDTRVAPLSTAIASQPITTIHENKSPYAPVQAPMKRMPVAEPVSVPVARTPQVPLPTMIVKTSAQMPQVEQPTPQPKMPKAEPLKAIPDGVTITSTPECVCPPEPCVVECPKPPRRSFLSRIFGRDPCKSSACDPVIASTPIHAKTPAQEKAPEVAREFSRSFREIPHSKTPTVAPESTDWRKSWGKVEPYKPETTVRVEPVAPYGPNERKSPIPVQGNPVVKSPTPATSIGTMHSPAIKTPGVVEYPVAKSPSQGGGVPLPLGPDMKTPSTPELPVVKAPGMDTQGTIPSVTNPSPTPPSPLPLPPEAPVVKTPIMPRTDGGHAPIPGSPSMPELPVAKTPAMTNLENSTPPTALPPSRTGTAKVANPESPVVKSTESGTPLEGKKTGPFRNLFQKNEGTKSESEKSSTTSPVVKSPSAIPPSPFPSVKSTESEKTAGTTPVAKSTESGMTADGKKSGPLRNLFQKKEGTKSESEKSTTTLPYAKSATITPPSTLPDVKSSEPETTSGSSSVVKSTESGSTSDGKKTGTFRSLFKRNDSTKSETTTTSREKKDNTKIVEPESKEIAKSSSSTETADKKPGFLRNLMKKGDKKSGDGKTEEVAKKAPASKPGDWGSSGNSLKASTLPETTSKSPKPGSEPVLPHAQASNTDPLASPSDFLKRKPQEKKSIASIPEAKTVTAAKQSEPVTKMGSAQTTKSAKQPVEGHEGPAVPEAPEAPYVAQGPTGLPPGAGSVLAAGNPQYIPVPIVTVPSNSRLPVPPQTNIPQAPQPNVGNYMPVNNQLTPPRGFANAFTKPGPQRPVPAETIPAEGTVNAFNDPPLEGQGTPPPQVSPLQQHSPARYLLTGYPNAAPQPLPIQGMPQQLPPAMPQMPYPPMHAQAMGPNTPVMPQAQSVPGVAWMPNPTYNPANYFSMPQASQINVYTMPQGMMPQGPMPQGPMPQGSMPVGYPQPAAQPSMQHTTMYQQQDSQSNVALLLKMLQESDYPSQREWAADQLSAQGMRSSPQVANAIMTAAREDLAPMVRACCIRCLVRMGVQTMPMTKLLEDLKADPDPRVRDAVQEATKSFGGSSAKR